MIQRWKTLEPLSYCPGRSRKGSLLTCCNRDRDRSDREPQRCPIELSSTIQQRIFDQTLVRLLNLLPDLLSRLGKMPSPSISDHLWPLTGLIILHHSQVRSDHLASFLQESFQVDLEAPLTPMLLLSNFLPTYLPLPCSWAINSHLLMLCSKLSPISLLHCKIPLL